MFSKIRIKVRVRLRAALFAEFFAENKVCVKYSRLPLAIYMAKPPVTMMIYTALFIVASLCGDRFRRRFLVCCLFSSFSSSLIVRCTYASRFSASSSSRFCSCSSSMPGCSLDFLSSLTSKQMFVCIHKVVF